MKPLYLSSPVQTGLGKSLRPGGDLLTRHIIGQLEAKPEYYVLDAGCGTGATMELLRAKGYVKVIGLDYNEALLQQASLTENLLSRADLAALPLRDATINIIVCECVWNLTDKEKVLQEFFRVLCSDGYLALSDIYLRGDSVSPNRPSWPRQSCFFQATDLENVKELLLSAGFSIELVEDHSHLLKQTAAEFVFAHGSLKGFWQAVLGDTARAEAVCSIAKKTRPGLFLLIAKRREQ